MANGVSYELPDDIEALIAAERGNISALGRRLGVNESGLSKKLHREGLWDVVKAARDDRVVSAAEPEAEDDAVSREEILEHEVRELRRLAGRDRKADVHAERITQAIERAVEGYRPAPPSKGRAKNRTTEGAHHRNVLLLSDFHGGEVVDPAVINGLNAYDWQIMLDRVAELREGVVSHVKNGPPLTGLDILFGGDMNSGANHDEITITNELPLAEQAVEMGALQASLVRGLAHDLGLDVRCAGVEGNHPRLTKAPAAKQPHNNGDWISNKIAAESLKADGIPFEVGVGSLIWKVAGRTAYLWHGDGIRSSMPGVPWGGVMRRTNQIQATFPYRIDHFFYGHFHQAVVAQGGRLVGNGALKGTDEWVTKNFGGGDPPTQLMLTFDERREWMTGVSYLTPRAGIPT